MISHRLKADSDLPKYVGVRLDGGSGFENLGSSFKFNLSNEAISSCMNALPTPDLFSLSADDLCSSLARVIPRASCLLSSPERGAVQQNCCFAGCLFHILSLLSYSSQAVSGECQASAKARESSQQAIIRVFFSRLPI